MALLFFFGTSDGNVGALRWDGQQSIIGNLGSNVTHLTIGPDVNANTIVCGTDDGSVWLSRRDGTRWQQTLVGTHGGEHTRFAAIRFAAITSDGKTIVSAGEDWNLRVWNWDGASWLQTSSFPFESKPMSAAIAPKGDYIVSGEAKGPIWFLRRESIKDFCKRIQEETAQAGQIANEE